jgi:hypothetical protein
VVLHGASRARAAASICSPCSPVVGIGCLPFRAVYAFTGRVEFNGFPRSPVLGDLARIRNKKRPRVYECYWAHFAAEIHLSE